MSSSRKKQRTGPSTTASSSVQATLAESSSNKNRKRAPVKLAKDADQVLAKCRQLKAKLRAKKEAAKEKSDSDDSDAKASIPKDIVEVDELSATEVLEGIESIAMKITQQVLAKQGFSLDIPSRAASNQIYVKEWDRIVLGSKRTGRSFINVRESRKSAITLRVMQLLHAVLVKRIHITKRDLFYTDVKLFVDQAESDGVLDDVATMIGCTRSNLHVVASDKGLVVGRIQFEEDGDPIDCTRMGVGGKAIPPYIDKIENIRSDAEFILLVEKEAAYMRMAVRRRRGLITQCVVVLLPLTDAHSFHPFCAHICRRTAFTTNILALSSLPRDSQMLLHECSWLASPMNCRSLSWDWWTQIHTV